MSWSRKSCVWLILISLATPAVRAEGELGEEAEVSQFDAALERTATLCEKSWKKLGGWDGAKVLGAGAVFLGLYTGIPLLEDKQKEASIEDVFAAPFTLADYQKDSALTTRQGDLIGPYLRVSLTGDEIYELIRQMDKIGQLDRLRNILDVTTVPKATLENYENFRTFVEQEKKERFNNSPLDKFLSLLVTLDLEQRTWNDPKFFSDVHTTGDIARNYIRLARSKGN